MQVHFMVHSEKLSTQIHASGIRKRKYAFRSCRSWMNLCLHLTNTLDFSSLFCLVGLNKSYQMNPANYREALIETQEDESEGADILLVGLFSS